MRCGQDLHGGIQRLMQPSRSVHLNARDLYYLKTGGADTRISVQLPTGSRPPTGNGIILRVGAQSLTYIIYPYSDNLLSLRRNLSHYDVAGFSLDLVLKYAYKYIAPGPQAIGAGVTTLNTFFLWE
ncbi:hypothetical protein SLA2020_487190 [Shorea laevis]